MPYVCHVHELWEPESWCIWLCYSSLFVSKSSTIWKSSKEYWPFLFYNY